MSLNMAGFIVYSLISIIKNTQSHHNTPQKNIKEIDPRIKPTEDHTHLMPLNFICGNSKLSKQICHEKLFVINANFSRIRGLYC